MNITSYRTFSAACLIVYALIVCTTSAEAQKKTVVKNLKKPYLTRNVRKKTNTERKKAVPQIVSGGVLNGKATILIKPEYPLSARAVGAYGTVSVLVLIDVDGKIVKASVTKGHPFLQSVSVKAALQSEFEPLTLGGNPVQVQGIIIYNFIPQRWNWLEISYTLGYGSSNYYSVKTLLETLPCGYEEERQLLNQWFVANENQDKIIETIIASIQSKLINDARTLWIFEVGLTLARYEREPRINGQASDKNSLNVQNLKQLVQNSSADANDRLLERMKKFIVLIDEGNSSQIYLALQKLEESFPYVGR